MKDRAMQALYLLALEPVAETTAYPNSYGFRPKRGCRDAIAQCFCSLSKSYSPRWILDADIKACFDWIDHDWLIWHWTEWNHGNKTPKWRRNHYWGKSRDKRHFFCLSMKDGKFFIRSLVYHPDVGLARYIKIRGSANPYSKEDREYFAMRESCANLKQLESKRILPLVYSA